MISSKLRILVIEDNVGTAELLRHNISDAGYVCEVAYDAGQGLETYFKEFFNVVIVDYILPGKDGLWLIKNIKEAPGQTPGLIVLTGSSDISIAVKAMKLGADDYLLKDTDNQFLELLPDVIKQVLDKKALEAQKAQIEADREILIQELEAFGFAIVHDLKQPLTVIQNSPGLIRRYQQFGMSEKQEAQLLKIERTVRKIDNILNGLLAFAQTRNLDDLKLNTLDMASIVQNVITILAPAIEEQEVSISLPDNWLSARGYESWIEQVWLNYIGNAIKYGGKPPVIELGSTELPDNMVGYWIKDNGAGISAGQQEILFLPFHRLKQIKAHGHGLGLTIVRQIVHKLGGDVTVDSEEGQGSRFSFTLPA